ncbi:DUF475 domain (TerC2) [Commensalibacter communis]|uniref:DUF475 domain (TerC2) n=1 Tax=Commensalibacter communis TaxID=2972786 RepID=A0A9W4X6V2_9PROT|nr:DUF475 domain-containing protein [Commensalibacter communis]CAI3938880.1 DUF475 domain (TerC2) [Commensalibacter communis]CAI3939090.1 DUF475 domain (TerC2) [Commensalibacter communis]CAI3939305.1 DUF475 domain (TerC2) [Commensalibacter communis]CAI3941255.1 DUF475 domain (TerC2) [Commensalibacter communis]CAI3942214.1 DUF475 domain (TerC2) [Commensalibacter communis]
MKYFKGSFVFTIICLGLAAALGFNATGTVTGALSTVFICAILGVLEVSLSFDNAVVNATVLKDMDPLWQRRFLTWGILIAVFGMRLVFPLLIVGIAAHLDPISALDLAIKHPDQYAQILSGAHVGIMGFGGSFLALVGLKFFFDAEKDVHWISVIETQLAKFSKLEAIEIVIVLLALFGISKFLTTSEALTFIIAGIFGIITFIAVEAIGTLLDSEDASTTVAKAGLGAFLYLEVLDASFSFDGVIGAFALSTNLFVIALGLGIGAMFVRSLTVMLVELDTLSSYRFLEHGAFWAILALSGLMFVSVCKEVPEVVTGLIGAAFILLALYSSIRWNKKHPEQASQD